MTMFLLPVIFFSRVPSVTTCTSLVKILSESESFPFWKIDISFSFLCRSTTLLIWLQTFLWIKRPLVAFASLWLQAKVHAYARTSERRVAKDFTTAGFDRKTATLLREVTPSRSDHPPPSPLAKVAACFFSSTSVL